MATVGAAWRTAQKTLEDANLAPAPREGQRMMAHVLGRDLAELGSLERQNMTPQNQWLMDEMLTRRQNHEPLAYILGYADFYGQTWAVAPAVLIPRPDTETLVEGALRAMKNPSSLVVEVGVGSGAVLGSILLERPEARGFGIDISPAALSIAHDNLKELKLLGRCKLAAGDLLQSFDGIADVIVSNPPYIAEAEWAALEPDVRDFEPKLALVPEGAADADGLEIYRRLIPQAFEKLRPGGALLVEIGHNQAKAVTVLFSEAGFKDTATRRDLAGRERVIWGRK